MNLSSFFEQKDLTGEDFLRLKHLEGAHRICFVDTHKNALRVYRGKYKYSFSLPFANGIKRVFEAATSFSLYPSKNSGIWTGLEDDAQKREVENWIHTQGTRVYLRDLLDLSMCLSMNMSDGGHRTEVGNLEHAAKYDRNAGCIDTLAKLMGETITSCPVLSTCDAIAAVPPRTGKDFDLPTELVFRISSFVNKPLVTAGSWNGAKSQLKKLAFEGKWEELEKVGFTPSEEAARSSRLLLIDDLYQSGSTLNFIGAKIKNVTRMEVMGLCAVKSMRDTDND